jgi:hypothetical protein
MIESALHFSRVSFGIRFAHALWTTVAVLSVFFTGLVTLKSSPDQGPDWQALCGAGFTLIFGYAALFLSRKLQAAHENGNPSLARFVLVAGYTCVVLGLRPF